ncbi:MAG: hypothetical protein GXY44_03100 [Phycisphaerales bacterium]|nr:hypothetical protein [Phycisphaerales bacterium]
MKAIHILVPVLLAAVTGGCTMAQREGAFTGGLLGGAAGGAIGYQSGEPGEGAAIGAATGALAGAILNDRMEQAREANPYHLSVTEIARMARESVPDSVIVGEIQRSRSRYVLDSETIRYLMNNNVSDQVINYMLSTALQR